MTLVMKSESYLRGDLIAADMHRDRKRVFVDLLKWNVPVVDGEHPVGVLSLGDVALERDPDSALADIRAARPHP